MNLGLTLAAGQWDQRLECAVNALLPALVAAGLFILGGRGLGWRWAPPLAVCLMASYGLPIAWHNVIEGFHSQQFFLIGFSLAAIAWLPFSSPAEPRWWLGAASAVLALGSMASGLFAAAVVIGLLLFRRLRRESPWAAAAPTLALCLVLIATGALLRTATPWHDYLRAKSVSDFAMSLVRSLQWPGGGSHWMAILAWLPWTALAAVVAGRNLPASAAGPGRRLSLILAGLGIWVFLQLLATAYARGAGGGAPASRYIDTLVFGQVVNGLCWAWMWQYGPSRPRIRAALATLGLAWGTCFCWGVGAQVRQSLEVELPHFRATFASWEGTVRDYLATGDEAYLVHEPIPYPVSGAFLERMHVPALHDFLPASVRRPLPLAGANPSGAFSSRDTRACWSAGPVEAAAGGSRASCISPKTPQLRNRVVWGSFGSAGEGRWQSRPVQPEGAGWLRFEVAGSAATPYASLELRDAGTGKLLARVVPRKVPGDAWRTVYVPEPSAPFVVAAADDGPEHWIAFTEPVEIPRLSYWAWRAVRNGVWVAAAALSLAGLFCAGSLFLPQSARGRF